MKLNKWKSELNPNQVRYIRYLLAELTGRNLSKELQKQKEKENGKQNT